MIGLGRPTLPGEVPHSPPWVTTAGGPFALCWLSVDGAGRFGREFETLEEAVAAAKSAQQRANTSESCGYLNPWGYGYTVRDRRGDVVFRAERRCGPVPSPREGLS